MDTTDILIIVMIVVGLAIIALLTINIRNGIKMETKLGQTATDASLAGEMLVLKERISTLEGDKAALANEVKILQQKVAELETQKITKLEDLNGILKAHIDTLNTKIASLEEAFALLKANLGLDKSADVTAVAADSLLVQPKVTPKATPKPTTPRRKAPPKEKTP